MKKVKSLQKVNPIAKNLKVNKPKIFRSAVIYDRKKVKKICQEQSL